MNKKKILILMIVGSILFPVTLYANEVTYKKAFKDVSIDNLNFAYIEFLNHVGAIQGYQENIFDPLRGINRAEFIKILIEGYDRTLKIDYGETDYGNCFKDVTDQWFAKYICYAYKKGLIQGYDDGFFRPAQNVNNAEAVKIVILTMERFSGPVFSYTTTQIWYEWFVERAYSEKIIDQEPKIFDPGYSLKREDATAYIFKSLAVMSVFDTREYQAASDGYDIYIGMNLLDKYGLSFLKGHYDYFIVNDFTGEKFAVKIPGEDCGPQGGSGFCELHVERENGEIEIIEDLKHFDNRYDFGRKGLPLASLVKFVDKDTVLIEYGYADHGGWWNGLWQYNIESGELEELITFSVWEDYSTDLNDFHIRKNDKTLIFKNLKEGDNLRGEVYIMENGDESDKKRINFDLEEVPYTVDLNLLDNFMSEKINIKVNDEIFIFDFKDEVFL